MTWMRSNWCSCFVILHDFYEPFSTAQWNKIATTATLPSSSSPSLSVSSRSNSSINFGVTRLHFFQSKQIGNFDRMNISNEIECGHRQDKTIKKACAQLKKYKNIYVHNAHCFLWSKLWKSKLYTYFSKSKSWRMTCAHACVHVRSRIFFIFKFVDEKREREKLICVPYTIQMSEYVLILCRSYSMFSERHNCRISLDIDIIRQLVSGGGGEHRKRDKVQLVPIY